MVAGGGAYGPAGGILSERTYPGVGNGYSGTAYSVGSSQIAGGYAVLFNSGLSTTTGQFGIGGPGENSTYCYGSSGGGGGYYGGGGSIAGDWNYSGERSVPGQSTGGTSYISGHTGCVAIKSATDQTPKVGCSNNTIDNSCSIHYSGYIFTNTIIIDGAGYNWTNIKGNQVQMPKPTGGNYTIGEGHTGNGYAKITFIGNAN